MHISLGPTNLIHMISPSHVLKRQGQKQPETVKKAPLAVVKHRPSGHSAVVVAVFLRSRHQHIPAVQLPFCGPVVSPGLVAFANGPVLSTVQSLYHPPSCLTVPLFFCGPVLFFWLPRLDPGKSATDGPFLLVREKGRGGPR